MKAAEHSFFSRSTDMFEKIAAIWPPIIRKGKKEKILLMLCLLARQERLKKLMPHLSSRPHVW